jgi:sterol desaturase/sphingolipid hydroxylase (fatty acid hydroxylase superfamily)
VNTVIVASVAALLCVFMLAEQLSPLRRRTRPMIGRLLVNGGMSLTAFAVAALLVRPAATGAMRWASATPFGIVPLLPASPALRFIVSFLLMDLAFYWWHVANHRLPVLWRFHNVHHIDPDLDVSTAFRFHWGEVALSTLFRVAQVSLIGISAGAFAAYELVFQANTLFHHSNLRLPVRFESVLNMVLVTPRMHGIHHSQRREQTNSNYSVVFSWWDRLHRTIGLNVPQADIDIGVPAYTAPADNRLWNALVLPFRRQRDYWASPPL